MKLSVCKVLYDCRIENRRRKTEPQKSQYPYFNFNIMCCLKTDTKEKKLRAMEVERKQDKTQLVFF